MNARGAAVSARRIPAWKYDENSIPGLSAICEDANANRFHNFKERKKNTASLAIYARDGLIERYQRTDDFILAIFCSLKEAREIINEKNSSISQDKNYSIVVLSNFENFLFYISRLN